MTNKTLTEKRFNEILKEREDIFKKKRFEEMQKFLAKGNLYFWLIGAGAMALMFLVMLATSFTTSILYLAQNGLWTTFNIVTGMFDFFKGLALFFFIGAIIFKVIKYFHKKRGINNGE